MSERSSREWIKIARAARREDRGGDVLIALREASRAALAEGDEDLIATSCWRLSKAEHDYGTPAGMLDALDPLREGERSPFGRYPRAGEGLALLSAAYQDRAGYADPRLDALWVAWIAAEEGDRWAQARGDMARAWGMACRGDLEGLRALHDRYGRMTSTTFGPTPTAHPDAKEVGGSVYFAQQSLALSLLWAAVWGGERALAQEAHEAWLDAAQEGGAPPDTWLSLALGAAALTLGVEPPALALLIPAEHHRVHSPLGMALRQALSGSPEAALRSLREAGDAAIEGHHGPEWAGTAWLLAGRLSQDPAWGARLAEVVASYGLGGAAMRAQTGAGGGA